MKRRERDGSLSPLIAGDAAPLRRLITMLECDRRIPGLVLASIVRRIADRLEAEGGDRVLTIPGGELRVSSSLSAEQAEALRDAFTATMKRIGPGGFHAAR